MNKLINMFLMLVLASTLLIAGQNQPPEDEKVSVVVVGHGGVPNDYPRLKEFFQKHSEGTEEAEELEHELLYWPRNAENDKYWGGFMSVVKEFEESNSYYSVHHAFNEFCAPTIQEALTEAQKQNPDKIVVVSIMITPGGGHSAHDISNAVEDFKKENPGANVVYAWPYEVSDIAGILNKQVERYSDK